MSVQFTKSTGEQLSFAAISDAVRTHPAAAIPIQIAVAASAAALQAIEIGKIGRKGSFNAWQLGALALAALNRPGLTMLAPDIAIAGIDRSEFEELMCQAVSLSSRRVVFERTAKGRQEAQDLARLQLVGAQTSLQGNWTVHLVTSAMVLGLDDLEMSTVNSDLDALFLGRYQCSARQYWALIFWLSQTMVKATVVHIEEIMKSLVTSNLSEAVVRRVLGAATVRADQIYDHLRYKLPHHEGYGIVHAFYSATPFVGLNDDMWLLPPHPFMRLQTGRRIVFHSIEMAAQLAESTGNPRPEQNSFMQAMGRRFELLVEKVLSSLHGQTVQLEYEYIRKSNSKSADFVIFEAESKNVVLVQAKMMRFAPGAFYGYDGDALASNIKRVAESVRQSISFLRGCHRVVEQSRSKLEAREINERVVGSKRVMLVTVMPMMPSMFSVDSFRCRVDLALREMMSVEDQLWWVRFRARVAGWHVLDIEELLAYASISSRRTLFDCLSEYQAWPKFNTFEAAIGGLKNFMFEKYGGGKNEFPPIEFRTCASRILDSLIACLQQGDADFC